MASSYIKVSDETEIIEILDEVRCDYNGQIGVLDALLFEEGKYKEDWIHKTDTGDSRIKELKRIF